MKKAHSNGNPEACKYIIKPYNDMEKVAETPVIATPFYKWTLKDRIKQWKGDEKKIKIFTKRLLTGFAHLHSEAVKMAHRDIKADNILTDNTDDTHPIIIDFGLQNCKNFASGTEMLLAPEQKGNVNGPFGSPKWWHINGWDHRLVDSWNIGLVLKSCFEGYETPKGAQDLIEKMTRV